MNYQCFVLCFLSLFMDYFLSVVMGMLFLWRITPQTSSFHWLWNGITKPKSLCISDIWMCLFIIFPTDGIILILFYWNPVEYEIQPGFNPFLSENGLINLLLEWEWINWSFVDRFAIFAKDMTKDLFV